MDIEKTNSVSLKLFIQGCRALGYEDEMEAFATCRASSRQHRAVESPSLPRWKSCFTNFC